MFFWAGDPVELNLKASAPKGTCMKQNTSFELLNVRTGPELWPVGEKQEKTVYIKKGEQKSQNRYISPLCVGAHCEPISFKFGVFLGLINVITYAENGSKIFIGFSWLTRGKTHVSL